MENSAVQTPEPEMAPLFGTTVTRTEPRTTRQDTQLAMAAARGIVDLVSPQSKSAPSPTPAPGIDRQDRYDHKPATTPAFRP